VPSICAASARVKDAGDLASLGYPELKVTVTDTGFEDVPEELPAGRYLLSVTGKTTKDMGAVAFLSPTPARMSASEVNRDPERHDGRSRADRAGGDRPDARRIRRLGR
jgi:hypothetical protein